MSISLDEVRHVARLARLKLTDEELMEFQSELNALLRHFEDIQHVDVANLPPKPHAVSMTNVWAEDEAVSGLSREEALANSAKTRAGLFIVPTIIEE